MKTRGFKHLVRKLHRWLGVVIGIQFLFWTVGGLYFSWTSIKEIRGDDRLKPKNEVDLGASSVTPQSALATFRAAVPDKHLAGVRFVKTLGEDFYEFGFHDADVTRFVLVSATSGNIRGPIDDTEAKSIASEMLKSSPTFVKAEFVTAEKVGLHHEYREKPLPAWALTLDDGATVYVSAENGQLQNVRTGGWRAFDFLWMLHTMGYGDRDDINNWTLRVFSVFGLLTIASGFVLFVVSSKSIRRVFVRRA